VPILPNTYMGSIRQLNFIFYKKWPIFLGCSSMALILHKIHLNDTYMTHDNKESVWICFIFELMKIAYANK
jgi:formate hydrogenlyase subunit 4